MPLNILYITQFYPPEIGAASVRAHEFVRNWSQAGHNVTVLTSFPNYPKGKIYPRYKNQIFAVEKASNVSLIRTFTYVPKYGSIILRILNQIIFHFFSLIGGLKVFKPDIVISSSPPFGVGLIGYLLSRFWKAKFVFEVRDVFPQSAIEFGVLRNKTLIRLLRFIEQFYYVKADLIVGATQGICDHISSRGIPQQGIRKITNGVNTDLFRKIEGGEFRAQHHLKDRFVVIYTGIHGRAEQLTTLIDAAKILKNNQFIQFVLIGDGIEKEKLIRLVNEYNLQNVLFLDSQPMENMPFILAGSDLCFSSRKNVVVNSGALPVKIFEYMACEKPVVVCIKGEAEELVREAQAGVCVDPDDPSALAEAISNLSQDKQLCKKCGKMGREYVDKFYNRQRLAEEYLDLLIRTGGKVTDSYVNLSKTPLKNRIRLRGN